MDAHDRYEYVGRKLLKEILELILVKKIVFNNDKWGHWDAAYRTKDNLRVLVEIKTRDPKYEKYDTHLMLQDKFDWLKEAQKKLRMDTVLYVNFFGDSSCYVYDLDDIKDSAEKEVRYCNQETAIFTGKVDKEVLMIPKEIGLHLVKQDGIWKKDIV